MTSARELVQVARPGSVLRAGHSRHGDETVLIGGGEVFRVPTAPSAVARHAVLVRALGKLAPLVPVALAPPRYVGVLADGVTPFTAERRLPGVRPVRLEGIALGQLEGIAAALEAVPVRAAQQWGVPVQVLSNQTRPSSDGPGVPDLSALVLQHTGLGAESDPGLEVLLADPRTGLLTGVVGWDLVLCLPAGH